MKPKVITQIDCVDVRSADHVHIPTSQVFSPANLHYDLVDSPSWLHIDSCSAIITGVAPVVLHNIQKLVTVVARNHEGETHAYFLIKVLHETFLEEHRRLTSTLSMRREMRLPHDSIYKTYSILDYIFALYEGTEYQKMFEDLVKKSAKEEGISVSEKLKSEEFKRVVEARNAEAEAMLEKKIGERSILSKAELNGREFRNLVRQGSAPAGSHPVAVWNYLGAPERHSWSAVGSVLGQATKQIIEIKRENQIENRSEHYHEMMFRHG